MAKTGGATEAQRKARLAAAAAPRRRTPSATATITATFVPR